MGQKSFMLRNGSREGTKASETEGDMKRGSDAGCFLHETLSVDDSAHIIRSARRRLSLREVSVIWELAFAARGQK